MEAKNTVMTHEEMQQAVIARTDLPMGQAIAIKQAEISFKAGLKEGIRMFAWWKDGVQYVDTCGTTLKDALDEVGSKPKSKHGG